MSCWTPLLLPDDVVSGVADPMLEDSTRTESMPIGRTGLVLIRRTGCYYADVYVHGRPMGCPRLAVAAGLNALSAELAAAGPNAEDRAYHYMAVSVRHGLVRDTEFGWARYSTYGWYRGVPTAAGGTLVTLIDAITSGDIAATIQLLTLLKTDPDPGARRSVARLLAAGRKYGTLNAAFDV